MSSDTFRYVFLPAVGDVQVKEASKAGGLENDELVKRAKQYFFDQSDAAAQVEMLQNATDEQRNALAEKFKQQQADHNPQLASLPNEQILQLLESSSLHPNCEIVALIIPTVGNGYQAVSMYISPHIEEARLNERASGLLLACGHSLPQAAGHDEPGIYGDVFLGRAYDNEAEEWKRLDFTADDLIPSADWMQIAQSPGGGGGQSGGGAAPSLSGTIKQLNTAGGNSTAVDQAGVTIEELPDEDKEYTWEQNEEEVEIRFKLPAGVKGKDVAVKFARKSLKVTISGETKVDSKTGGPVVLDDSTYTLQDEGNGRELFILLAKAEAGKLWARPFVEK
jgi:hypothetical protein